MAEKGKAREVNLDQHQPEPDRIQDSPLSYNQLVSAIVDFLEVAIHTILCLRSVYPFDVFARRKKYNHACYQSRHPGLNEYISRVLAAARREIEASKVSKLILVIRPNTLPSLQQQQQQDSNDVSSSSGSGTASNDYDAYERFVFGLDYILPSSLIDSRNRDLAISQNVTSAELELIFRGFMQKLMVVDGILYDIPPSDEKEPTFAILLEMVDDETPPAGKGRDEPQTGDWIPAETENLGRIHPRPTTTNNTAGNNADSINASSEDVPRPKIRPIKSLDSGVINMMLYVEEDLYAKSGSGVDSMNSHSTKAPTTTTTSANRSDKKRLEESLLHTKATQSMEASKAREIKNRAKRLDAERDLDQPALAQSDAADDIAQASKKRKKARMVLGETRAAESDSDESSTHSSDHLESSQSITDGGGLGGGSDMDIH